MQFVEFLLWLTNPDRCSNWNNLITITLVPLALILQPLGPLFGSLYVIPWNKSSEFRKYFIYIFSIFIISWIIYFYNDLSHCTTITPQGHLLWASNKLASNRPVEIIFIYLWAFLIILPFLLFWDRSFVIIAMFVFIPLIGFLYDIYYTDSKGSIWCFYTSYSSIIAILLLGLYKSGMITMA